ncbi:hypothetical protein BCR33DRAFT_710984 [Rhizoclosmatium globosum]|uniref:ERCC4 domain-containing protein n=1 Tax=Rhizoclosmatium globosum TaxID=329046 RepID=A0A1Y2D2R8_9FUNG|nr:hypothetical protein BCR33DRAFT_710984 [Rhizoclosmatium globosum]|eukprot:ORY53589.1 hypothetical protein BCR33DRAFT_710984 [Rhizoclosmatium globosum]
MLAFHRSMVLQLLPPTVAVHDQASQEGNEEEPLSVDKEASDGMLVAARGLGLQRQVLVQFIRAHATPANLVFLLGASAIEATALFAESSSSPSATSTTSTSSTSASASAAHMALVAAETPAPIRTRRYLAGGVVAATPRILVVDLLNGVVPLHLVTGVIVCHAHRISETSTEAFILRLIRDGNKVAFIRAFSESPESLTSSGVMWKLEKTMKQLFLRKVFFWPRFHMEIQQSMDAIHPPISVRQVRVPLSKLMSDIQAALLDCIHESIQDIKRVHKFIDPDELSVENALFSSFEGLLKMQLDPIWHRVPPRTKQVVSDIGTLRRLLGYLTTYDSVAFYSFLESIRAANALDPLNSMRTEASVSPWLMYDATDVVFTSAKKRVFRKIENATTAQNNNRKRFGGEVFHGIPDGAEIVAEEQPKWSAVRDLVVEIGKAREAADEEGEKPGPILIMVHGERTATQLCEVLSNHIFPRTSTASATPKKRSLESPTSSQQAPAPQQTRRRQRGGAASLSSKVTLPPPSTPSESALPEFSTHGVKTLMSRQVTNYFKWRGTVSRVEINIRNKANRGRGGRGGGNISRGGMGRGGSDAGRGGSTAHLRRRARGGGSSGNVTSRSNSEIESVAASVDSAGASSSIAGGLIEGDEIDREIMGGDSVREPLDAVRNRYKDPAAPLDLAEFNSYFGEVDVQPAIIIRPYATSILSPSGGYMTNGDDDSRMLEEVRPSTVIMYDVDTAFIRRLEVFHAQNGGDPSLTVYFMVYDNSIEEQKYLTSLRKEKDAFERLIREKANMAIPIDQDGRVVDPEDIFWRNMDTRVAGGQATVAAADSNQVIVDVREFRSALPSILHSRRMKIKPCTLEVGDYVLTPQICVERKSIPDLVGSFKSGRLYTQAEAMCLHYQTPILLIEFAQGKAFSLGTSVVTSNSGDNPNTMDDLNSKLALLAITFPKLRIIWSSSPTATAEIFEDLKKDQREPSVDEAMAVGVESGEPIDSVFSITPSDMIRALPGITSKNYRNIMRRVGSIAEIAAMGPDECQVLVGEEGGRALWEFMNDDLRRS